MSEETTKKKAVRGIANTKRMLEAANRVANGITVSAVAKEFEVHESTVRAWMKRPEVQESFRAELKHIAPVSYAKALRVLNKQLDSKNEWVAQTAAREVLTKMAPIIGVSEKETDVTIKIEGMPDLGTPSE